MVPFFFGAAGGVLPLAAPAAEPRCWQAEASAKALLLAAVAPAVTPAPGNSIFLTSASSAEGACTCSEPQVCECLAERSCMTDIVQLS